MESVKSVSVENVESVESVESLESVESVMSGSAYGKCTVGLRPPPVTSTNAEYDCQSLVWKVWKVWKV